MRVKELNKPTYQNAPVYITSHHTATLMYAVPRPRHRRETGALPTCFPAM